MAYILKYCSFCLILLTTFLEAKDLGIQGHVFSIEEADLLEMLKMKSQLLSKEEVGVVQDSLQRHYSSYLRDPSPIQGLGEAKLYRVTYVDPTICADEDMRNEKGQLIVRKGACINPLQNAFHLDALLFFDATNPRQLEWAKGQNKLVKWILVRGKPLELEELENHPVYFDQFGVLIEKFGVENLPAKVSRDGLKLKVEEFPIGRSTCVD